VALNAQISRVAAQPGACRIDGAPLAMLADLARLPVLRKSDLTGWQTSAPPFGGIAVSNAAHVFQSPGPIYEPGGVSHDWWRMGRFLHALGIGPTDTVQNCFSYHFVPAGMIFESGARAVGARVFPAGTGQTELQVRAAVDIGCTAYAGTPDYLKIILDKADEMGERLAITRAAVGGGALFPSLRAYYRERGIDCANAMPPPIWATSPTRPPWTGRSATGWSLTRV
jgi:phenylacetate-CoA ligase